MGCADYSFNSLDLLRSLPSFPSIGNGNACKLFRSEFMDRNLFLMIAAAAIFAPLHAQTFQRSASMRGSGNGSGGKCTLEVVVDGAADVEIRGGNAILRNLEGRPPQWRRFECNGVLPPNPADFRFQGIDGRGRQTLIRDPRDGAAAVVRIEDPQGGSEGYTFDITWS